MAIALPAAFVAGFGDGILLGISTKTGMDISHEGIAWILIDSLCKNTLTGTATICGQVWIYGLLLTIIGFAALLEDIGTNWIAGILGLVIGFIMVN